MGDDSYRERNCALDETEYLTPMQVARILNVRIDTVLRHFGKEPGVIDMTPKDKKKPDVGGDAGFGFHVECSTGTSMRTEFARLYLSMVTAC